MPSYEFGDIVSWSYGNSPNVYKGIIIRKTDWQPGYYDVLEQGCYTIDTAVHESELNLIQKANFGD